MQILFLFFYICVYFGIFTFVVLFFATPQSGLGKATSWQDFMCFTPGVGSTESGWGKRKSITLPLHTR